MSTLRSSPPSYVQKENIAKVKVGYFLVGQADSVGHISRDQGSPLVSRDINVTLHLFLHHPHLTIQDPSARSSSSKFCSS